MQWLWVQQSMLLSMLVVVTRIDAMVDMDGLAMDVVCGPRLSITNWHRHCEAHEGSIVVAWLAVTRACKCC
jgi:hypothetical protein